MVYHVLANGVITKDITGHVVKVKDAEAVYRLLVDSKKRRQYGKGKGKR